jgi:ferredoxin
VDCIKPGNYQGQEFMIIGPEACIDCSLCLPECPIGAILETEDEDPTWAAINKQLAAEFNQHPSVPERPRLDPPRQPGNVIVNR